jgi:SynChlorMet cassette radical SAM/SPASM protein ScmF
MVKLAESMGAHSVKFNVVQPMGRGEGLHRECETIPIQELVAIGKWVENELAFATSMPIFYDHPLAFRPMSRMFGECAYGCSQCKILNIIGVLSDGSYALCGVGEAVPDLGFGHVTEDRLEDVWRENPVILALRDGMPHRIEGICSECVMRFLCLGACVAQNYYRSGSLWATNWFCEEAMKAGLFPSSRMARP